MHVKTKWNIVLMQHDLHWCKPWSHQMWEIPKECQSPDKQIGNTELTLRRHAY